MSMLGMRMNNQQQASMKRTLEDPFKKELEVNVPVKSVTTWDNEYVWQLFASHLTEYFKFTEIIWKFVARLFLGIELDLRLVQLQKYHVSIVVSSSCRNVTYRSSSRPVAGSFTYRPPSRAVSKVTHILSYCRNIVKLLSNTYTFDKIRGSLL